MKRKKVLLMLSVVLSVGVMTCACGKTETTANNTSAGKSDTNQVTVADTKKTETEASGVKMKEVKDGKITISVKGYSFDYDDDWTSISNVLQKAGGNVSTAVIPKDGGRETSQIDFKDARVYIELQNTSGKLKLNNFYIEAKDGKTLDGYSINGIVLKTPEEDIIKVYGKTPVGNTYDIFLKDNVKLYLSAQMFGVISIN